MGKVMGKDKNHKNPLKRMGGKAPGASLPLWPYKSKLLTPKPKACHHPLSEGKHSLQGDKHKKHFVRREQERNIVSVSIWYAEDMCVCKKCVFLVYRLAVDAKPERVMMWPAENL